jgi:hypothetical protein
MLIVAALSDSPPNVMLPTFAAGVIRFPLELNVKVPLALDDGTGSWIRLPEVEIFAPVIDNFPAAEADTVTPAIPASASAVVDRHGRGANNG